jgi:dihydroorotase
MASSWVRPRADKDVGNPGVLGGRVAAVTAEPLNGARVIDAEGLVVAPGFIDPLTSVGASLLPGALYKVTDSVTTVLSLHGGPVDVAEMYRDMSSRGALLNYGTNIGHGALRSSVGLSSSNEEQRVVAATAEQIDQIVEGARQGTMGGALGIGFGLQYVPSTTEQEVFRLFELGARYGVPSHLPIRYLGPQRPINSVKAI